MQIDPLKRRDLMAMAAALALTWPVAAQAGPKRVGILMSTADTDPRERQSIRIFLQTLTDLGWVEGRNIEFSYGWGVGDAERMEAKARAIVALNPDVLLVKGAALPAAREATSTIPIVFVITNASGIQQFAPTFARPGGNATGFTSSEVTMAGKRLQLLHEMSPGIARALYITNPLIGLGTPDISERLEQDARTMGVSLTEAAVSSVPEINAVVERLVREGGGGLVVAFNAFTTVHRSEIVALANRHRLAAVYPLRVFADEGGLFSYGLNQDDEFRRAAAYVDRILRGEKPGDLPIQEPTRFELVINLKAAKALGFTIPPTLLARADEVIE
jgi:putative tryptophan/tyrosine transport system substrate-binding protein